MTPSQRALARHALGLPNDKMRSYRNRYYIKIGPNHKAWREMAFRLLATSIGDGYFRLTVAGAKLALDPGETLDMEDF